MRRIDGDVLLLLHALDHAIDELLDLLRGHLVERGQRLVVGLGARVLGGRDHLLTDDDDRQQDQLQEVR